jgi:peptide/nickel transport system permease protein
VGLIAGLTLAAILVLAIVGPFLAPFDPYDRAGEILSGPNPTNLLGTDYLGRDILSRLLAGAPLSVFSALLVVVVGFVVGVVPALVSVYSGRTFEWVSLRVMDTLITIPFMIFAVAVTQLIGNGVLQAMIVVGVMVSPAFYRVTRSATISVGSTQYVEAAYLSGASTAHVLRAHVWHKVLPVIGIAAANIIGVGFIVISALTFLGIGVQPPNPTWGGMLATDLNYLAQNPTAPLFPSVLITVTIIALNGLADALRDVTGERGGKTASTRPRRAAAIPQAVAGV